MDREEEVQHLAGFEPMTYLSRGSRFTAVLQPLPPCQMQLSIFERQESSRVVQTGSRNPTENIFTPKPLRKELRGRKEFFLSFSTLGSRVSVMGVKQES